MPDDFESYLRFGFRSDGARQPEKKFNPYHDERGRFTFAPGGKLTIPPRVADWMSGRKPVDRSPRPASTTAPKPATRINPIPGYPETSRTAWRSANDAIFAQAADRYNAKYKVKPGDPDYKTPEFMKAWAMRESGGEGDRASFVSDPFQVNVPGDWTPLKHKVTGLEKHQAMTPVASADAALAWLRFKSEVHDIRGNITRRHSLERALQDYNARKDHSPQSGREPHKVWYARTIIQMARSGNSAN
jgi:hypothetical protein